MKCPACSNEMSRAQATDYGAMYDYCRTCKKELAEITKELSKPVVDFDGSNFQCGQRVDQALKYCKPTCGMNKQQAAVNPVPMTGDTAFFNSQYGSCGNLYKGCDCNGCTDAKDTVAVGRRYIPNHDAYIIECQRKAFPCRFERVKWTRSGSASVHYHHAGDSSCHCGSLTPGSFYQPTAGGVPGFSMPMFNSMCAAKGCAHTALNGSSFCPVHGGSTQSPPDTY